MAVKGYLVFVPFGNVAAMEYGSNGAPDKVTVATEPGKLAGPFEVHQTLQDPAELAEALRSAVRAGALRELEAVGHLVGTCGVDAEAATALMRGGRALMGRAVIKQPDGRYAVFSTGTDQWIATDMTREQYIEWRVKRAAQEARADAARLLDDLDAGLVYTGYSFDEANALSVENGGEDLSGKAAAQPQSAVRPARLSADLTMADGRTVHVPAVPPAGPALAGRIKVEIPYPPSAMPGLVISAAVTNEVLGVIFRSGFAYTHAQAGDTLTIEFGEESIDGEALAKILGGPGAD